MDPADPKNGAPGPALNTPPSPAACQYPSPPGAAATPTTGLLGTKEGLDEPGTWALGPKGLYCGAGVGQPVALTAGRSGKADVGQRRGCPRGRPEEGGAEGEHAPVGGAEGIARRRR